MVLGGEEAVGIREAHDWLEVYLANSPRQAGSGECVAEALACTGMSAHLIKGGMQVCVKYLERGLSSK